MSFASLNLNPALVQALAAAGYTEPTPVQAKAIPPALTGFDLMVSAPTGTGKPAAFVLPALHRLALAPAKNGRGPRVLVLTPTRELALQVTAAVDKYCKFMRHRRTGTPLGGVRRQHRQARPRAAARSAAHRSGGAGAEAREHRAAPALCRRRQPQAPPARARAQRRGPGAGHRLHRDQAWRGPPCRQA